MIRKAFFMYFLRVFFESSSGFGSFNYICANLKSFRVMAVIKTSTLGQARKSIGATNYYRRAGVQIARSKPTFAPGRQFTDLQLLQQARMRFVQFLMLDMGARYIADYANCRIRRLYNASSRYNRLVGLLLPNTVEQPEDVEYSGIDYWKDLGWSVLGKWSIGNVSVDFNVSEFGVKNGQLSVSLQFSSFMLSSLLRWCNKRRSASLQYLPDNIGLCGFIGREGAFGVISPTFGSVSVSGNTTTIVYPINLVLGGQISGALELDISLFVAYRDGLGLTPLELPIYGTSNVRLSNLNPI